MVFWRGVWWMTSEHAYQAAKFWNKAPRIADMIHLARSAHEAFKIAREHDSEKLENWGEIKVPIMKEILQAKLKQHEYIQRKLLQTGDRELVEDSPADSFWGRGPDWQGQNQLGKLWMKLREQWRQEASSPVEPSFSKPRKT